MTAMREMQGNGSYADRKKKWPCSGGEQGQGRRILWISRGRERTEGAREEGAPVVNYDLVVPFSANNHGRWQFSYAFFAYLFMI